MIEDPDSGGLRDAGPRIPPRSLAAVEYAAAARRRAARAFGLGFLALGIGLLIVAVVARDSILDMWPSTAGVYRTFGLTETPAAGLQLAVTAQRTVDSFIVEGDIVNGAAEERRLPPLRLSLQDAGRHELEAKVIDPPVETLAPGVSAHFTAVFAHPSMTASEVAAAFVSDR